MEQDERAVKSAPKKRGISPVKARKGRQEETERAAGIVPGMESISVQGERSDRLGANEFSRDV